MAGILASCVARQYDRVVSFLLIGPTDLCHQVTKGLLESAKHRKWKIAVHRCELVSQVIQFNLNLGVDFIIFVLDCRVWHYISEIETNISLIDEHYIISGAICLVNCKGITYSMAYPSFKLMEIQNKYNIRCLNINISPEACVQLGNRTLNLVEAILGITSGIPSMGLQI